MNFGFKLLVFLWILSSLRLILFWLYIWQLKEYHIGRLIDHFRTHKGKKLIFGILPLAKIILFILLLLSYYLSYLVYYVLLAIYIAQSVLFARDILRRNTKIPKLTAKTVFLTIVSFSTATIYLLSATAKTESNFWLIFALLLFDILAPLIVSAIVLIFQPFFAAARSRILKKASQKIKKFKNLTVIGIAGSYGKTSTKEFLSTILAKKFNVLSTSNHQNSEVGIAQCILNNLTDKHEIFVVEMGAYRKGGIKLLCDIVGPKIGIVTGVNEQHLALFGSMENLLSAEGGQELADALPGDGKIFLNGDNRYCLDLYKNSNTNKRIYVVEGNKINSDIWAEEITVDKNYISFIARLKDKNMAHFQANVLGKQNVQNLLGAILVSKELGMNLDEISAACKNIEPEMAGITLKKNLLGINIIDSSYSSNPDGVYADLDYLNIFDGKKVIVMPCLIELGKKSAEIHREIGRKIGKICNLAIIVTKEGFREIKKGAIESGMKEKDILLCDKPRDIYSIITLFCKAGDAVLLEGRVSGELIKLLNK